MKPVDLQKLLIHADSELSAQAYGRPASPKGELLELSDGLRRYADDRPVTEDWLRQTGWSFDTLSASKLIPSRESGAAITEVRIEAGTDRGWSVSLLQGMPDDPHCGDDHVCLTGLPDILTRGQLTLLLAALGDAA